MLDTEVKLLTQHSTELLIQNYCHVTVLHMFIKKMVSKTKVKGPVKLQINFVKMLINCLSKPSRNAESTNSMII